MNREDYLWYKEHHICTHCRKERALDGKTLCLQCSIDNCKYKKKYNKELQSIKDKEKRAYRKANNICTNCGVKPQQHGLLCNRCYSAILRRKEKNRSDIARSERVSYGMCYICGKEALEGKGVCLECYKVRYNSISKIMYMNKYDKSADYWDNLNGYRVGNGVCKNT